MHPAHPFVVAVFVGIVLWIGLPILWAKLQQTSLGPQLQKLGAEVQADVSGAVSSATAVDPDQRSKIGFSALVTVIHTLEANGTDPAKISQLTDPIAALMLPHKVAP